jgi:RNA polymerase sigma factor (sigma-70 family)
MVWPGGGTKDLAMRRSRPDRNALFRAAIELASNGSSGFKATARRYSLCAADAEDAYQRGLEILITKAPTDERAELRPWLNTVIKHEALAIRRQRERTLTGAQATAVEFHTTGADVIPEEHAPEKERAQRTAEALSQLKPGEVQCLLLKALGYSYDEISAKTGFSWTKVNRLLTQGRKRFFDHFAQIESGKRCSGFRSLLSLASDGEAGADDQRLLETHLRGCSSCRAALREYRALPGRLAAAIPPAVLVPEFEHQGWFSSIYETVTLWTADRGAALSHKLQQVSDAVSAQKATAVVASTAALTGGAVVHERATHHHKRHHEQQASRSAEPPDLAPAPPDQPPPAQAPSEPAAPAPPTTREVTKPLQAGSTAGGEFAPDAGPTASQSAGGTARAAQSLPAASNTPTKPANRSPTRTASRDPGGQEFTP